MLRTVRRRVIQGIFATLALTSTALASDLPAPKGEVILTVTGSIGVTNSGTAALFDLASLQNLGESQFTTSTIWTEGENTFTGVSLATLLTAVEAETGILNATAINDYSVSFPVAEALADDAIIAYQMNGKHISIREKGPLWILYPFDDDNKYKSETYYSRSIWHLNRIEITSAP